MTSVPPISVPLSAPATTATSFSNESDALKSFEAVFLSQVVDKRLTLSSQKVGICVIENLFT